MTDAVSSRKVLLVSPPWRVPDEGCLSLATLRPILTEAGISCDELHGTQLYPYTPTDLLFLSSYAAHFFVPCLYPTTAPESVFAAMIARFTEDLNLQGFVVPGDVTLSDLGRDEKALRASLGEELAHASLCVDRCVERCVGRAWDREYDVIGFSVTFESQLPAALAVAQRIKARKPEVRIAFGGAACFRELADALLTSFPSIDAVCYCEGEQVIVPLVGALCGDIPLETVPGIAWRKTDGRLRHTPSPPPSTNLDELPAPDYDKFVTSLEASAWASFQPKLFFETSRGCWWGQRKRCSFCGLDPTGVPFRHKSSERVFAEVRALHRRYPSTRRLQATDNILDMAYLEPVLRKLARFVRSEDRPLRIFLEVRPSLSKEELRLLSAAGVDLIQPGIESLSDAILKLLNKGCSALGQVRFIKWATEAGIMLVYNLIVRNPGEDAQSYNEMTELVDAIDHLPPPSNVTPVWLERFSPFHTHPERYGITNIRHKPYYDALFPGLPIAPREIAYVFDYDHESHDNAELFEAQRAFVIRVGRWQRTWEPNRAYYRDGGDVLEVVDRRGPQEIRTQLEGDERELFLFLDRVRNETAISRRFAATVVSPVLDRMTAKRWVIRDAQGRYMAVLPRKP